MATRARVILTIMKKPQIPTWLIIALAVMSVVSAVIATAIITLSIGGSSVSAGAYRSAQVINLVMTVSWAAAAAGLVGRKVPLWAAGVTAFIHLLIVMGNASGGSGYTIDQPGGVMAWAAVALCAGLPVIAIGLYEIGRRGDSKRLLAVLISCIVLLSMLLLYVLQVQDASDNHYVQREHARDMAYDRVLAGSSIDAAASSMAQFIEDTMANEGRVPTVEELPLPSWYYRVISEIKDLEGNALLAVCLEYRNPPHYDNQSYYYKEVVFRLMEDSRVRGSAVGYLIPSVEPRVDCDPMF